MAHASFSLRLLATAALSFASLSAASLSAQAADAPAAPPAAAPANPAPAAAPVKDYTILKVGNEEIRSREVEDIWKGLFPAGSAPDFNTFDEKVRQNVLRGMASEKLIYGEALKAGYDKNPEVQKRLANLQRQVVMQAYVEEKAKTLVTEDQLKKAYAEKVAAMKGQEEVKASHILVASEEEAKTIAKDLKKGGDFAKTAQAKSTDKGSGAQGGDLGWFTKDRMVPEFADAAFKLKKGELSEPVKSSFGWHIIKLEDRRPVTPPTYDEMKENLRTELANKAVQDYVEGLLKTADIKYYAPDGKEKEFSRVFQQPDASAMPAAGGQSVPQ